MQKYFIALSEDISRSTNEVEVRVKVIAATRLLMQQTVFAVAEWVGQKVPDPSIAPPRSVVDSLWQPADGTLVDALDSLLICADQTGWTGISRVLIKNIGERPASEICGDGPKNLIGLLRSLVKMRNDGAEGHGLVGGYKPESEADAFAYLVETLSPVIPKALSDNRLSIGKVPDEVSLKFLRSWNEAPALIRRIRRIASDRVRVYCQFYGANGRAEFNYDAANPFAGLGVKELPSLVKWENTWEPDVFMPDRKTDSFTGRQTQVDELLEWYEDQDARACLVYGDGGYGKTTLAIEFVHRVLNEEISVSWQPKVVIFHTAKRTQWGLNGLEQVKAGQPHLTELLVSIHVLLFGSFPANDFYRLELSAAVSQLQGKVQDVLGLRRKEIWIVLDNTETLVSDEGESRLVGREIKEVARRLGRVLLTSRRAEHLEASPIEVPVLDMREAVDFVRERCRLMNCNIEHEFSDKELEGEIEKIERRPIVLEAFVGALCDPSTRKISRATERVSKMLSKDLGEFLFADVWAKLSIDERRVLLLMARVGDVHQSYSFKTCCEEIGVTVSSMERVLQQSSGIASIVTVANDIQVSFSKNFVAFAIGQKVRLADGSDSPTSENVVRVTSRVSSMVRNASRYLGGMASDAVRTPLAKAAEVARREGRIDESQRLFEQAIASDSMNGQLRARFAYFLFSSKQDMDAALHQAKAAVDLLQGDAEAWFLRGMIEARKGDVRACDLSLSKAEELGIPWYRCSVQLTWGLLKARPAQLPLASKELSRLDTYLKSKSSDHRVMGEVDLLKRRMQAISERRARSTGRLDRIERALSRVK